MNARAYKPIETGHLPDTRELLHTGGDSRILTVSGFNEYGCGPSPDSEIYTFGSSTASTISPAGFAAADALRQRLVAKPDATVYDREFGRIRRELTSLCGLGDLDRLELLFTASGTDTHLIASRLTGPDHIIMVEGAETGRGVATALAGRHFSTRSPYAEGLTAGEPLAGAAPARLSEISIRTADGEPRGGQEIDDEIAKQVSTLAKNGRRILLVLVDVSKSGMIAPSPACAADLKARFPQFVDVLVDACQFRMAPSTLKAYLECGFMVALTGSKFLTGPTFSGALLIPGTVRRQKTPAGLTAYASRFEWPERMRFGFSGIGVNFGLLLRWEAAMAELRTFRGIPDQQIKDFLKKFAAAIRRRLETDTNLETLTVPIIRRLPDENGWDQLQTIFPFRLRKNGIRLSVEETSRIHILLQKDLSSLSSHPVAALRCSLGQPISCGTGGSALRMCASARLAAEGQNHADRIILRAFSVFDKIDLLLDAL
ncbi:MAG: hypothetical protein P4L42_11960 [Desulfocapsaceae bacterium]|nr:hypothetical protein [Desulfocapsaceae bacterium]